jgi:hypothetical protein
MGWPEDPGSLLAGPRGRRLCWVLATEIGRSAEPRIGPAWHRVWSQPLEAESLAAEVTDLASELAAAVNGADWHAVLAETSDAALVGPLAESVAWAMYWQPPDCVDRALAHPELADELRLAAQAVTEAPAARWWSTGLGPGIQQYVEALPRKNGGPPLSGAAAGLATWRTGMTEQERLAAARPADPAAPWSGYWWSSPVQAGLACTTRALPGLGALQIVAVEDWPGWEEVLCWPVTPRRLARIYEITGPDDWAALVTRYPLDVTKSRRHDWWKVTGWAGTWLMPDYAAVAADFDAIHLTVGGYLTTAGRALVINDARCLLAGWDPDATYWLADVLTSGGPAVRWIRDDSAPLGWRQAGRK